MFYTSNLSIDGTTNKMRCKLRLANIHMRAQDPPVVEKSTDDHANT